MNLWQHSTRLGGNFSAENLCDFPKLGGEDFPDLFPDLRRNRPEKGFGDSARDTGQRITVPRQPGGAPGLE
jgi:hypothetical protein